MRTLSTLVFLSLLYPTIVTAQPDITALNMPMLGDVTTIGLCSDPIDDEALDAAVGAMQTWDFSGLTEQSQQQFTFVDPSGTPWASDFPASNLCGISWDGSHSYYITGSDVLATEGNALVVPGPEPQDTSKLVLADDPENILALPYSFGDFNSDTFSGYFEASGFAGTVEGSIDLEVDGYGTLILPNGTYEDVVRYRFEREQTNTLFGSTTTTTKTQWGWVSPAHRFWLLLMEKDFNGFNEFDVVWYNKMPIGAGVTALTEMTGVDLNLAPNPVLTGTTVQLGMSSGAVLSSIEVVDGAGRVLRSQAAGLQQLPTDGLVPGMYLVRGIDRQGNAVAHVRFILQ
ncbi:MAG TPA: T9SS type A sorting domain-containing protein [Flavobacteriales bacterium]|nr:T9SS type A sorting domain-containing protein [Flavobacteriales bacterium]HNU55288.1 T9SS type A sorting domain-containing protein [Flavobacteriales bacterium]